MSCVLLCSCALVARARARARIRAVGCIAYPPSYYLLYSYLYLYHYPYPYPYPVFLEESGPEIDIVRAQGCIVSRRIVSYRTVSYPMSHALHCLH